MQRLIKLTLIPLVTLFSQAKAQERPYIQEEVIKAAGVISEAQLNSLSNLDKLTRRYFLDGLGRVSQTVIIGGSPNQKDIVSITRYDQLGRQAKSYLPYTGSTGNGVYRPDALQEQAAFYNSGSADKIADDTSPYSEQLFENSPLQRLLQEGSTGAGFQPGQHAKTMTYRHNSTADDIWRWNISGLRNGSYPAATLYVTELNDEQGAKTQVFTDGRGKTILKRQPANGAADTWLDTYYVYNRAGLLTTVIPPQAVAEMRSSGSYNLDQDPANRLLFSYRYDDRGRIIEKKVPEASPLYIVYDFLDRPLLLQDAKLRTANKWNYIKYDIKGHAISQGLYTDAVRTSREDMQAYVNALTDTTRWYEDRSANPASGFYSNLVFPSGNIEPLAYSYFDDYDLDQNGIADYAYQAQGLTGEAEATPLTRGFLTIVSKRSVGAGLNDIWLLNTRFYDKHGNLIQERSNNQLSTAVNDSKTSVPDFTGKTKLMKVMKSGTSGSTSVISRFSYDHSDRLLAVDDSYNNAAFIQVAAYQYNELGQLVKKNLHAIANGGTPLQQDVTLDADSSVAPGQQKTVQASRSILIVPGFSALSGSEFSAFISSDYLQSVDYRYNIRGQLISINNSSLTPSESNDDANDLFGMELLYERTESGIGNAAYYDGRLSAVKWMSRNPQSTAPKERSYCFTYDKPGRLKDALYKERANKSSWTANGAFDEKNISYDPNGNILRLDRNASIGGAVLNIDNLTYAYSGNQLSSITDGGSASAGYKNLTGSAGSYTYDESGNLVSDPGKGISHTYNELNRTEKITITTANGRFINYTYDAAGILLRKQAYDNGSLVKTTDYIEGFVYEDGVLVHFPMAEGRIRNTGGGLKSEYMIRDQQGNVRVSFEEENGHAAVRQENSYYPYGMVMPGGSLPTQPNRKLYNGGAEWQNDYGDLPDYYNTYYRNYDPATGRFVGIDPLAAMTDALSPYQYADNNPVTYNDPLGDKARKPTPGMELIMPMQYWKSGRLGGSGGIGSIISQPSTPYNMPASSASMYEQLAGSGFLFSGSGGGPGPEPEFGNGPYSKIWQQLWHNAPVNQWVSYAWSAFAGAEISADEWVRRGGDPDRATGAANPRFYGGGWVANFGNSVYLGSESANTGGDEPLTHEQELAKYGQISSAYSMSTNFSFVAGATYEYGIVVTDKGWHQYYQSVYYSHGLGFSISGNGVKVSPKAGQHPTFSDWKGAFAGITGGAGFLSGIIGTASSYNAYGIGLGIGGNLTKGQEGRSGSFSIGNTILIGEPYRADQIGKPGSTNRYIRNLGQQ